MPKVTTSLIEQFADLRSNELAFKFVVENQGTNAIEILSITPRIPEGIKLIEVKDPSMAIPTTRYNELCQQLTDLATMELLSESSHVRKAYAEVEAQKIKDTLQAAFGGAAVIATGVVSIVSNIVGKILRPGNAEQIKESPDQGIKSLEIKIENANQASNVYNAFFRNKADKTICRIFQTKMLQLREIEKLMERGKSTTISTVESESFFAATYILRFPRSIVDPRKYNIDIEVNYKEDQSKRRHIVNASTSVIISPRPFVLSMIAIFSGLLGVLLRISIDSSVSTESFWPRVYEALIGNQGITAIILAFIIFNIYEHTEVGSKIRLGIGWRSAVLIGALCGLLSDRILAALQSLIQA